MDKLGIKYEGCQDTVDNLKKISNVNYQDLINDLKDVLASLGDLTYKPNTSEISNSISNAEEKQKKLINFADALESYAKKIYEFDNAFYKNFVLLDGTNLENYKNSIGDIEISDDQIQELFLSDKNSLERYLYLLSKAIRDDLDSGDDSLIKNIIKEIKKFKLSPDNCKALELLLNGNSFKVIKNGDEIFIKLKNTKWDISDLERCAKYLHDELNILNDSQLEKILSGRSTRKLEKFIERLMSDKGAKIYDKSTESWSKYAKNILKGDYEDLNKYINKANMRFKDYIISNVKESAVDDLLGEAKYFKSNLKNWYNSAKSGDIIDDVLNSKGAPRAEFLGKAFGLYDKAKTIWDNANDDLKDENGNWTLENGQKNKKFVVDTTVDLSTSAGAAAAGAAIGSVVPVAGTVVGAVAGAAIGVAINYKFGDPPESVVDKTKELANDAVDKIGNCIGKIFW